MRLTYTTVQLAAELLKRPDGRHWGFDLSRRTGTPAGVVGPVLNRLAGKRWLVAEWENPAPEGAPRRKFFTLTPAGRTALTDYVARAAHDPRFTALNLPHDGCMCPGAGQSG